MKYDPATGIFGMDFYVVLARPGFRVARRKHCVSRVGKTHRITKSDAQAWFKVRGPRGLQARCPFAARSASLPRLTFHLPLSLPPYYARARRRSSRA